jgi:hypothetical protein
MIFFLFQVGLNFLIKVCLFLRLKNDIKEIWNFLFFSLHQINIFLIFLYYFDVMI